MGSQNSRTDQGNASSNVSNQSEKAEDSKCIVHNFRWTEGGKEVYLAGSFNGWTDFLQMSENNGVFELNYILERGKSYQYKFIVDHDWRFDPSLPTMKDPNGNINNFIDISTIDEASNQFSQEIPTGYELIEPEPLPIHLNYALANHSSYSDYRSTTESYWQDTSYIPMHRETCLPSNELPVPPTVLLNHIGFRHTGNLIGLTSSSRYKGKVVTTLYYKTMNKC